MQRELGIYVTAAAHSLENPGKHGCLLSSSLWKIFLLPLHQQVEQRPLVHAALNKHLALKIVHLVVCPLR